MMLAGVETEVEPVGVVFVRLEFLGASVEVEIDIFDNIAHDKDSHKFIIA